MIRKRKREVQVVDRSEKHMSRKISQNHDHDIFRQYFESQFEPLEAVLTDVKRDSELEAGLDSSSSSSDSASLSEWEGLSLEESHPEVEVFEYGERKPSRLTPDLQHVKAFMSAKPPLSDDAVIVTDQKPKQDQLSPEETAAEATNLKHDLELQRLLKESHLFDRSRGAIPTHTSRHKAIDLRMQSLGAKTSLFAPGKMPLSHHRGMIAKAKLKDAARRKEATENGIILEKNPPTRSNKDVRRERGIGAPTVGRFKGGTLVLSRRDLSGIQDPGRDQKMTRRRRK